MATRVKIQAGDEIVNQRTGQRMVFRTTAGDTGGRELIIECSNPPHRAGAPQEPLHTHPRQTKRFSVTEGKLTVEVDGKETVLSAGDEMTIAPHEVHRFWNAGEADVRYGQEFRPALRSAEFFVTLFALERDGKLNGKGMPSPLQLARTGERFQHEIMVTSPPPWLQRVVFTIVSPIARLLGYEAERA